MIVRRLPALTAFALLILMGLAVLASRSRLAGTLRAPDVDFAALAASRVPLPADLEKLAVAASRAVLAQDRAAFDSLATRGREPRLVFVSVRGADGPVEVRAGFGRGVKESLARALDVPRRNSGKVTSVKVDFVQSVAAVRGDPRVSAVEWPRDLRGLGWSSFPGLGILPEEIVRAGILSRQGLFQPARIGRLVEWRRDLEGRTREQLGPRADETLWSFTTRSWFIDARGARELYRGHPKDAGLGRERVLVAAREGAEYLARSTRGDGRFDYVYLPKSDHVTDTYNIVRHAGTIYSMLDVWETTRDAETLAAADRALRFLERSIEPWPGEDGCRVLHYGGKVKLGGIALAVVALCEHATVTGKSTWNKTAQSLGRSLLRMQGADGKFLHQMSWPDLDPLEFRSQYYPGEAQLALCRLHQLDGDSRWIDAAERGARYLIEVRDRGVETLSLTHDHWLLYALDALWRARPKELWVDHGMRISKAITAGQRREVEWPDHRGSWGRRPRATPAATRNEGLLAAYRLARDAGRPEELARLAEAIRLGLAFQETCRIGPERGLYLPDPARARGGVTRDLDNFEVRIDYVQHAISALIAAYRVPELW